MKTDKKHQCTWAFATSLGIAVVMIITAYFSNFESVLLSSKKLTDFNRGWIINGESYTLPQKFDIENEKSITLEKKLPLSYPDESNLFFLSSYNDIEVYINEALIYFYGTHTKYLFSDNPGSSYQIIHLPKHFEGENIKIILTPKTHTDAGTIPTIYIGTNGAIFYNIIVSSSFVVITSALILILSLYFVFQSALIARRTKKIKGLLYLGVSGVIFSIYTSFSTMMWQFFVGNSLLVYFASFYCLMLLPIALMLCVKNLFAFPGVKLFNFIIILSAINVLTCTILEITGFLSLVDSSVTTHIINIASILVIYYMFLRYRLAFNMTLQHGLLLFTTTILLDIIRRLFDPYTTPFFSIIGMIVFLFFVGKKTLDNLAEEISEGKKYKNIAYHDTLTGAHTLMALNENIRKISDTYDYGVAVFDLNSLKYYNDKFGHSVGDYMLTTAVRILNQAFYNYKYVYRIGGDEFLIIMPEAKQEDFDAAIEELLFLQNQASVLRVVEGESIIINFAYGFALCENESFESVRKKADSNMYSKKNEQKSVD